MSKCKKDVFLKFKTDPSCLAEMKAVCMTIEEPKTTTLSIPKVVNCGMKNIGLAGGFLGMKGGSMGVGVFGGTCRVSGGREATRVAISESIPTFLVGFNAGSLSSS